MPRLLAVHLLGVCLLSARAHAGNPMADLWNESTAEIQAHVAAKEWPAVERKATKLGRRLMELVLENDAAPKTFSRVAALRALALAEMGRTDDAEWFWLSAQALSPEASELDFGVRSPAWDKVRARRPRSGKLEPRFDLLRAVPPKAKVRTAPSFPGNDDGEGTVVVFANVTTSGRLRDPLVIGDTTGSAAKRYSALETLVRWRFRPAALDGVPVEIPYRAEIRFESRR